MTEKTNMAEGASFIFETNQIAKNFLFEADEEKDSFTTYAKALQFHLMTKENFRIVKNENNLLILKKEDSDDFVEMKKDENGLVTIILSINGKKVINRKMKNTFSPIYKTYQDIFKAISKSNEKNQEKSNQSFNAKNKKVSDEEIETMSEEYREFPREFKKAIGKMIFVMKHGDADEALRGGGVITRGKIIRIVNNSLMVVKSPNHVKEGHIFLGLPNLKGLANAYIHLAKDGYLYIGSMSSHLVK